MGRVQDCPAIALVKRFTAAGDPSSQARNAGTLEQFVKGYSAAFQSCLTRIGRVARLRCSAEWDGPMWALFEEGELTADSKLTGVFARDERTADADAVLIAVEDAREEALRRELGRKDS